MKVRSMQKTLIISAVFLSVTTLVGCEKPPLKKLQQGVELTEKDDNYWNQQRKNKTKAWAQVIDYCNDHYENINCDRLLFADMIDRSSKVMPKYGSSGEYLEVPDFAPKKS